MNVLNAGIYNLFKADTSHAFYTGISGRFYHVKAPQNATFPYAVYDLIIADDELNFTDENESFQMQFDIFTQSNSTSSAGTLLAAMKTLYDDCTLIVTGYRFLKMTRDWVIPNNDLIAVRPVMGYSVQYDIWLEKAR